MSNRLKISSLTDIRFVEVGRTPCCGDGPRHKSLKVPSFPGGFLRGQFEFQSKLKDRENHGCKGMPPLDLVWSVKSGDDSFSAGASLFVYKYVYVQNFDPTSGKGLAIISIPLWANNMGFPPLYPGDNNLQIFVGLEGELCFREDQADGIEHTFSPIKLIGDIPQYSILAMTPNLDLQHRSKSTLIVYANSVSKKERVANIELEVHGGDPCGVEYPKTITIAPGDYYGEGYLYFKEEPCGNDAFTGVIKCVIDDLTAVSMPLAFSNLMLLREGVSYKQFLGLFNNWHYCSRNSTGSMRNGGVRTTYGPCETGGLVWFTCPQGNHGFYTPHKCSFWPLKQCKVVTTTLTVPMWQVTRTWLAPCQTMRLNKRTGRWELVRGNQRVCRWTPVGQNGNITVPDCQ